MGVSVPRGAGSQRQVQRLSLAVLSGLGEQERRHRPPRNRAYLGAVNGGAIWGPYWGPAGGGSARWRAPFISGRAPAAEGNGAAGHRPVSGEGTRGTEDVTESPASSGNRRGGCLSLPLAGDGGRGAPGAPRRGSSGAARGARAPGGRSRRAPARTIAAPARGGAERGGPGAAARPPLAAARPLPALSPRQRHRRRRSRVHARWSPRLPPPAAPAWTFGSTPPPPPPWARCPARTPLASGRWIIITATRYGGARGVPGLGASRSCSAGSGKESAGSCGREF